MVNLKMLQRQFQRSLLSADRTGLDLINEAASRFDVYENGYVIRLVKVLTQDFPKVTQLLGDQAERFFAAYLMQYPPVGSMYQLAEKLPNFLGVQAEALGELAQLEWALARAMRLSFSGVLHAPISGPMQLHPSVQVLRFQYAVVAFFTGKAAVLEVEPEQVLVWRQGGESQLLRLAPEVDVREVQAEWVPYGLVIPLTVQPAQFC